jgi:hypothetical protein
MFHLLLFPQNRRCAVVIKLDQLAQHRLGFKFSFDLQEGTRLLSRKKGKSTHWKLKGFGDIFKCSYIDEKNYCFLKECESRTNKRLIK